MILLVFDDGGVVVVTVDDFLLKIHRDIGIYFPHQSHALPFDFEEGTHGTRQNLTGVVLRKHTQNLGEEERVRGNE